MDPPPERRVLLTGEGDFSFAFAYALQADDASRMIATCYDDEEAIKKHKGAEKNIQLLKDLGATVVLGVDATKLHEKQVLHPDHLFSCIIFNFPHIGGKSNIKKNRALLKDFFISATQVLEEDGKICVSLCRGQGGTPSDKPRREWANTWQIVSMATYGGLILKEVKPFRVEDYPQYASTGFRSRDQWFHTNDALIHVFVKSLPNKKSRSRSEVVSLGKNKYRCQLFIARKLNMLGRMSHRNMLSLDKKHPTAATLETVLRETCDVFASVKLCFPPEKPNLLDTDSPYLHSDVSKYYVVYKEDSSGAAGTERKSCSDVALTDGMSVCDDTEDCNSGLKRHIPKNKLSEDEKCPKAVKLTEALESSSCGNSVFPACISKQLKALGISDIVPSHVKLLPLSLVEKFMSFLSQGLEFRECKTIIFTGVVFERCPVAENRYPARRELMVVKRDENETSFDEFSAKALKCVPDFIKNSLRIVHHDETEFDHIVCSEGFVFRSSQCEPRILIGRDYHLDLTDLKAYEPCSSKDVMILDEKSKFCPIGYFGVVTPEINADSRKDCSSYSFLMFDLDKLTKEMCGVGELRLLWSEDQRIFSSNPDAKLKVFTLDDDQGQLKPRSACPITDEVKFVNLGPKCYTINKTTLKDRAVPEEQDNDSSLHEAVPLSLYPIKHRHDVTFWENCQDDFDEQLFFDSVRNIADDNVKSVTLVNEFDHSEFGHSRCYRQIYQSCDRALSYHMSHDLQNAIRLTVKAEQGVTLR